MDKKKIKNVRGTKDILPDESYKWWHIEQKVRKIFEVYNYREIRTPIFEETELFERGIGEFTDIVSKEMYTFIDKGGTSLTLKPEMTASVMRAYLQYEINKQTPLFKVYYISPMFRQERPQAGRLRQFHQIGAEAIGSANPEVDAEIIYLVIHIIESFGVKNYNLKINSVGCQVCRPTYKEVLKSYFEKFQNELSEDSKKRLQRNPLRILDSKDERDKNIAKNAPLIYEYLCDNCRKHFENLQDYLNFLGVKYENEPHLVRGLDYYTKTAFEITSLDLGSQDAIAGGGRYDLLSKDLGGPEIPGVGFALGVERLMLILEKNNYSFNEVSKPFVYVTCIGFEAQKVALKIAFTLRQNMIPCEVELLNRSLKAQMKEADRQEAQYVVIIGDAEIENGKALVRNMADGKQVEVELNKITEFILSKYAEETSKDRTGVQI
ncbi:MAG: histidine--tRNA ligase [Candidatus Kryptonium sp.]|nr:histidine--tRNA ligase [Candidatus Kryptonium sp.]MCX7761712.1 histidine--tRNA ligase [Candidatus Kryptonium sp.]MDW8109374.1 histidine--tRNA ligase [Candidatus Kryptonium sp.]